MHSGPLRLNDTINVAISEKLTLLIHQTRSKGSTTGWLVWPVAIDLCNLLIKSPEVIYGKTVLEVGSGTGIVGLVCGILGTRLTILTDLTESLPICRCNVRENIQAHPSLKNVCVEELLWGDQTHMKRIHSLHGPVDVIIGSDVIYHQSEEVLESLVSTIFQASHSGTKLIIAYEDREGMIQDEVHFFGPIRERFKSLDLIELGMTRVVQGIMFDNNVVDTHSHHPVDIHHEGHHSASSFLDDPTAGERVVWLPGGKVMVVDLGIQSFMKNLFTVAIAGAVALGAGALAYVWAGKKLKNQPRPSAVTVQKNPQPTSEGEESENEGSEKEGSEAEVELEAEEEAGEEEEEEEEDEE